MPSKQTTTKDQSLSSQSIIVVGMLLSCMAWLIHVSMSITPSLWDGGPYLGHNILAEIAPVVATVERYERITADIDAADNISPNDSATYQLYAHYPVDTQETAAPDIDPIVIQNSVVAAAPTTLRHHISLDSSFRYYSGNNYYATLFVTRPPVAIAVVDFYLIALIDVSVETQATTVSYATSFLRPLSRAPPSTLLV